MPTVAVGYGRNRREWREDDPNLAAAVVGEMTVRLNEDAHVPQAVMACACAADTALASLEALRLDTTDTIIWRRSLVQELVRRLQGVARLVVEEDADDSERAVAALEHDAERVRKMWADER